jgi:hypothetical protein
MSTYLWTEGVLLLRIQELHKDRCASVFFSTWKRCTDAIDQNSWTEEASSSCLAALASTVLTRVQPFHQIGHVSRTPRNWAIPWSANHIMFVHSSVMSVSSTGTGYITRSIVVVKTDEPLPRSPVIRLFPRDAKFSYAARFWSLANPFPASRKTYAFAWSLPAAL